MHKLKLLLLLLGSLTPLILMAQPPGYLGKRASVTLNLSGLPVIKGPTQNNRGTRHFGEKKKGIGFNYAFEADFSYVVGRYRSLSLKVGQYYTGALSFAFTRPASGTSGSSSYDYHELFNRVNVRSVGIIHSKFKKGKGGLAPIGNRFYWGLKRSFISAEIIDKKTNFSNDGIGAIVGHLPLEVDQSMTINSLLIGWSNNQVFWDKLMLKTGIQLSFPLILFRFDVEDNSGDSSFTNQENFEQAIYRRVLAHEIFRLDIGLGYLLF